MARILLVEDEPGLQVTLTDRLQAEGYETILATDGISGYEKAMSEDVDLIVLDVMLPGKNGFDVCRDLRNEGLQIPVLMLTARGELPDKVVGLKLGADDYLTKPFEMLELLARVEVLLRRGHFPAKGQDLVKYKFADIDINFKRAEVLKKGLVINLSAQEFRLLRFLVLHRGETLSRDDLLKGVWEYDDAPTTRTVDVHILWLRQKLETNPKRPQYFVTVHGLGYKFTG